MRLDLRAAASFIAAHGRILDRRRFQALLGEGDAAGVFAALDAYRNHDGGYGSGLEPDLRSSESQPAAAMHALEVLAEHAVVTPRAAELCSWLETQTLADGGLPLALPVNDPSGCAPFWAQADPTVSSLQMTTQVAANAPVVGRHDPAVADHPWLARYRILPRRHPQGRCDTECVRAAVCVALPRRRDRQHARCAGIACTRRAVSTRERLHARRRGRRR